MVTLRGGPMPNKKPKTLGEVRLEQMLWRTEDAEKQKNWDKSKKDIYDTAALKMGKGGKREGRNPGSGSDGSRTLQTTKSAPTIGMDPTLEAM